MAEIVVPLPEDLLQCSICFNDLDENCKKFPCECRYSYCVTCLRTSYVNRSLTCPTCRKKFSGDNLIETFPRDFTLVNIIEQAKKNPSRPRNENADIEAAQAHSMIDHQNEMIAKLEEQMYQTALESSKKDELIKKLGDKIKTVDSEKEHRELEKQLAAVKSKEAYLLKHKDELLKCTEKLLTQLDLGISKTEALSKNAKGPSEGLNSNPQTDMNYSSQSHQPGPLYPTSYQHPQPPHLMYGHPNAAGCVPYYPPPFHGTPHYSPQAPNYMPASHYGPVPRSHIANHPIRAPNNRPASHFGPGPGPRVPPSHPKAFRSNDGKNTAAPEVDKTQRKPKLKKSAPKHEPDVKPKDRNKTAKPENQNKTVKSSKEIIKQVGLWNHCLVCGRDNHKTYECKFKDKNTTFCTHCKLKTHFVSACITKRLSDSKGSSPSDSDTVESDESE